MLMELGLRVVAPDMMGYGRTVGIPSVGSLNANADLVLGSSLDRMHRLILSKHILSSKLQMI